MQNRIRLLALMSIGALLACAGQAAPEKEKTVEGDGFSMRLFDSPAGTCRVIAVNEKGAVLGVREVPRKDGAIFYNQFFYFDGKKEFEIPTLEGFTNLEVEALSDDGKVVGYVSRRMGTEGGSLKAIVWSSATQEVTNLEALPGDIVSQAQDISSDGKVISGYSTGANPERLRPCVWTWNEVGKQWDIAALPVLHDYNPYLMSSSAVVSPDGKRVAACVTEKMLPGGVIDSALFAWEFEDGEWKRRMVSSEQMHLHAMNNSGVIAADLSENGKKLPCRADLEGNVLQLKMPGEDMTGEASDVNEAGVLIGVTDNTTSPDGGPKPVIWRNEQPESIPLPDGSVYGAAYGINDLGQIVGLTDVVFKNELVDNPETGEQEPLVKSVGFLWTPLKK